MSYRVIVCDSKNVEHEHFTEDSPGFENGMMAFRDTNGRVWLYTMPIYSWYVDVDE